MVQIPKEFFSQESILTLTGAAGAAIVVGNTVRKLLSINSPWVPFLVSAALGFAGAHTAGKLDGWVSYILATVNSCLIFCTAAGIQDVATTPPSKPAGGAQAQGRKAVRWLEPWF